MTVLRSGLLYATALVLGFVGFGGILSVEVQAQGIQQVEQASEATPLGFAQRRDVSSEISASDQQVDQIQNLQQESAVVIEVRLQATLGNMNAEIRQEFLAMSLEAQQQFQSMLNAEISESVELEMLDEQVLNEKQMNRFNQLWNQNRGVDALTSGPTRRQLDMSPNQVNQIQQIQSNGNQLMDECRQSNIPASIRNQFITNIQNIVIQQSISILDNAQVDQLVINFGEPFKFDSPASDVGSVGGQQQQSSDTNPAVNGSDSGPGGGQQSAGANMSSNNSGSGGQGGDQGSQSSRR